MADVTLLVTNGGPHPPDKWAALAAGKVADLIQIDEQSDTDAAAVARKAKPRFSLDVADAIEDEFLAVTNAEAERVVNGLVTSRTDPFDVESYLDDAVSSVVEASGNTPFSQHFANPAVQQVVRVILKQYFLDAANIQRSWSFDAKGH